LEIDARGVIDAGIEIQRAGRTVFLIQEVLPEFMKKAEPQEVVEEHMGQEES
jgi:RNA:NAD 2'-phosphotransferase (TPT1/KptA family)